MSSFTEAKSSDLNIKILDGYSLGATVTTDGYALAYHNAFSVQLIVSSASSPVGTFDVEASNDNVNWFSLTNSQPLAVTAAGSFCQNFRQYAVRFVRAVYTRTSGSATGNIILNTI